MNGVEVEQLVAERLQSADADGPMMSGASPAAIRVASVVGGFGVVDDRQLSLMSGLAR